MNFLKINFGGFIVREPPGLEGFEPESTYLSEFIWEHTSAYLGEGVAQNWLFCVGT